MLPEASFGEFRGDAISAVAHILLRTQQFTSNLELIYAEHPSWLPVTIYLDLFAQLQAGDRLDLFPLIQNCGASRPPADVVAHMSATLLAFDSHNQLSLSRPLLSVAIEKLPVIAPPPSQSISTFFAGKGLKLAPFFLVDVRGHDPVPECIDTAQQPFRLYAVVCRVAASYVLFVRDSAGWIGFRDGAIGPTASCSFRNAVMVGYVASLAAVDGFRPPQFTLKHCLLDRSRMAFDTSERVFAAKDKLVEALGGTDPDCESLYRCDDATRPERCTPAATSFARAVNVYQNYLSDPPRGRGFLRAFVECTSVELTFQLHSAPGRMFRATFHPDDDAAALFRFCREAAALLKLSGGVKLFHADSRTIYEFDREITAQRLAGRPITITIESLAPAPDLWPRRPMTVDRLPATEPVRAATLNWCSTPAIPRTVLVLFVSGYRQLKQKTIEVTITRGMTGKALIVQAGEGHTFQGPVELRAVADDRMSLVKVNEHEQIEDLIKKHGQLRVQAVMSSYCHLVILKRTNPITPSGEVYHMPLDLPRMVDLTSQTRLFAQNVKTFLAPRSVQEVGVVERGRATKWGTSHFQLPILEKGCVYVLLAGIGL
jgi:hypothetical protein